MDSSFSHPEDVIVMDKKISICQNKKLGYAGEIWNSAYLLSSMLLLKQSQKILKNKTVLEIGSGTGICGIFAAISGAKKVYLTDREQVLDILHLNHSLNKDQLLNSEIITTALDWNYTPHYKNIKEKIDFIIASDIIYHGVNFSNILGLFQYFSLLYQPEIILSYTDRGNSSAIEFFEILKKQNSWKIKKLDLKILDHESTVQSEYSSIFSLKYIVD